MKSQATFRRAIASNRGSTLAAALALAFLVFVLTTACLIRVASSATQVRLRHTQTAALFLADAGVNKAARSLLADKSYTGEKGTALATGTFDVSITRREGDYAVKSTGYAASPTKRGARKSVGATVRIESPESFRITDWREDP